MLFLSKASRCLVSSILFLAPFASAQTQRLDAESGSLNGVTKSTAYGGYTGSGYVTGFTSATASVTVWPWITSPGQYHISVRYRAPYGDKKAFLLIAGKQVAEISLPMCTGWCIAKAGTYTMPSGSTGVGIQQDWGWYEIDWILLSYIYNPVDPNLTASGRSLLRYIQQSYGAKYLSGQQDPSSLSWVESNIGKTPAILGNDFIDYSPTRVQYGSSSHAVEDAMAFNNRGGINAFVWHWNAPTCLYNTAAEPWWSGFYTRATCFDFQEALNEGPNGNNYKLLLRDIDAIATQIGRLRDANIPILFRPLHEPEGGWFWWGTKGSGAFKQLWDLIYNRLTGYHGLHNMIWVCNTANSDWYPGNNKCDIASVDIYSWAGDHSTQSGQYNTLKSLTQSQKVIALSEVGDIPDPEAQARENIPWAYWVTWGGNFISDGQYNSKSFLQSTYNNQYVTTMDKIGNWRGA